MKLARIRNQWERLGRRDPLWAVLTVPGKSSQRWEPEDFFRTGREEIDSVLMRARGLGLPLSRQRALDFGCGVGRLTQALAEHFQECHGVDISASMLAWANRYNRAPKKCRYHLNSSPDLAIFQDRSFSFIYSFLVLQHIPPDGSRGYIREFLRVLEVGGLLVFHLTSHEFPGEADSTFRQSTVTAPLPLDAFHAEIVPVGDVHEATPGQRSAVKVLVRNTSDSAWPALGASDETYQVQLGGRWLDSDGKELTHAEQRTTLPRDVPAGDSVELFLSIEVPPRPGCYWLELDMVQEQVSWFAEHGSSTARIAFFAGVEPGMSMATTPRPEKRSHPPVRDCFRRRHPGLHRLFDAIGLTSTVRALRRARVRWQAFNRGTLLDSPPDMDMHGIPKREVLELLRQCGGTLLDAEPMEMTGAGWQSYRYWVTKSDGKIELRQGPEWRRPLEARIQPAGTLEIQRVGPGATATPPLTLTNAGGIAWVAAPASRLDAVFLGAHAFDGKGRVVSWDFLRLPLPTTVRPGEAVSVDCSFRAPGKPGAYVVRVDLVMEGVCWFETHGSAPVDIAIEVTTDTPDSRSPGLLMAGIAVESPARVLRARPGTTVRIPVRVANEGNTLWLDRPFPSGGHVSLGGHLYSASRELLALDLLRAPLPRPVAPGETVDLVCEFQAPDRRGRYVVELDMVDEGIVWFGAVGSPTVRIELDCC